MRRSSGGWRKIDKHQGKARERKRASNRRARCLVGRIREPKTTDYSKIIHNTEVILGRTPPRHPARPAYGTSRSSRLSATGSHGLAHIWNIASSSRGAQAINLDRLRMDLAEGGKLSPLIDCIRAGYSEEWDGSNTKGRLNEDAQDASDDLEHALSGGAYIDDTLHFRDASDCARLGIIAGCHGFSFLVGG
jgi:hypothetical protein